MIAFKGTNNLRCQNITYEVGKTYTFNGEIKIDKQGFHACEDLRNVHLYHNLFDKETVVLKVEILGDIIKESIAELEQIVTNKFKVLEIIKPENYNMYSEFLTSNSIESSISGMITIEKYNENGYIVDCQKLYKNRNLYFFSKYKYDENNNLIYYENSYKYWQKWEYDLDNNLIKCENPDKNYCIIIE